MCSDAIETLKVEREPFDYCFHNRVKQGQPGLYAFWLQAGACLYVGQSKDISRRLYQHRMHEHNPRLEKFFTTFPKDIQVSYVVLGNGRTRLRKIEELAIHRLRPLTNISHRN